MGGLESALFDTKYIWKCSCFFNCCCWWKKSSTSWYGEYPITYKVLYIPGGAGFLPSTVCEFTRAYYLKRIFPCPIPIGNNAGGDEKNWPNDKEKSDHLSIWHFINFFYRCTVDGRNPAPPGIYKILGRNNGMIIILGGAGICPSRVFPIGKIKRRQLSYLFFLCVS